MSIETELKALLVEMADEYRAKTAGLKEIPPAFVGAITIFTTINMWLDKYIKGESDMEKLKTELRVKLVSLDDIPTRRRKSQVEDIILDKVAELDRAVKLAKQQGGKIPAMLIEEGINFGHFSGKLSRLKKDGKVEDSFYTVKRKEQFFLVKK